MELPINDKELKTIVSALRFGGDPALYQKVKTVMELRETHSGVAYKQILRERYGMVA